MWKLFQQQLSRNFVDSSTVVAVLWLVWGRRWSDEDYIPEECHRDQGDTPSDGGTLQHIVWTCISILILDILMSIIFSPEYMLAADTSIHILISNFVELLCWDLRSINGKSSRNTTIKIKTHSCHKLQPTTKASSKWSIGINFLNLLHWKNAWSWYFWIFLKTCVVCCPDLFIW